MKVTCLTPCFYNGRLYSEGEVLEATSRKDLPRHFGTPQELQKMQEERENNRLLCFQKKKARKAPTLDQLLGGREDEAGKPKS